MVAGYIANEGVEVAETISLEISDNLAVGARDPLALVEVADRLDLDGVDAIVLSACVQMPSLAAIEPVEQAKGLPVLSASVATTFAILRELGLPTAVSGAGALLDGSH